MPPVLDMSDHERLSDALRQAQEARTLIDQCKQCKINVGVEDKACSDACEKARLLMETFFPVGWDRS